MSHTAATSLQAWVRDQLVCPRDRQPLADDADWLVCPHGHRYPCPDGIPVLVVDDVAQTHWIANHSLEHLQDTDERRSDSDPIDAFVRSAVPATCGNLYATVGTTMDRYPIPAFPFGGPDGALLLDIGCNWGRWTFSAARAGFRAVGLDPSLVGIRAARRVAAQLGIDAAFVVGDARFLPFRAAFFDAAFSYSVLQHFSVDDAAASVAEIGRVLRPGGRAAVQMPNKFGLRNLVQQARRRFATPSAFEVRYWTPGDLRRAFERHVGPAALEVDGFFTLNGQVSDIELLPRSYRLIVRWSNRLKRASARVPPLKHLADSLLVTATRADA